jgi:hypothetical protein
VVGSSAAGRAGELALDPEEELQALVVAGGEAALQDRESQALQAGNPAGALNAGDWNFAVHLFTSFQAASPEWGCW